MTVPDEVLSYMAATQQLEEVLAANWSGDVPLRFVISETLPLCPTLDQYVVRIVRHGMSDVLNWLGEEVGPEPDDKTHFVLAGCTMFVSASANTALMRSFR